MFVKARRPAAVRAEPAAAWPLIRNMALFLVAPFVGLLYAVLLPFVGLGMLAWFAVRTLIETGRMARMLRVARRVALIAAAPFIALAYVIAIPFIGLGMLAWVAVKAAIPAPAR
jgi:hypothetical protein